MNAIVQSRLSLRITACMVNASNSGVSGARGMRPWGGSGRVGCWRADWGGGDRRPPALPRGAGIAGAVRADESPSVLERGRIAHLEIPADDSPMTPNPGGGSGRHRRLDGGGGWCRLTPSGPAGRSRRRGRAVNPGRCREARSGAPVTTAILGREHRGAGTPAAYRSPGSPGRSRRAYWAVREWCACPHSSMKDRSGKTHNATTTSSGSSLATQPPPAAPAEPKVDDPPRSLQYNVAGLRSPGDRRQRELRQVGKTPPGSAPPR